MSFLFGGTCNHHFVIVDFHLDIRINFLVKFTLGTFTVTVVIGFNC